MDAIKTATPLTMDDAIIIPYRLRVQVLIEQLSVTLEGIKKFDQATESIASKHPDFPLFDALPGAGPSLAPRLLVAFGEDRSRFQNAADLQKYSGIAPVTERSGKKHWVHWRWQCPTFLGANVHRMGGADDQQIVLGGPILSAAAGKRLFLSSRSACFGV
ncbi:MAG: transposase [Methyloglobulus sp.]